MGQVRPGQAVGGGSAHGMAGGAAGCLEHLRPARDLRRGGKPDFYAVTLVEGEPSVGRTEVGFIDQHESFDLDATSVPALVARLTQIADEVKGRSSTALLANLHLLIHAAPDIHDSICEHVIG